MSLSNKIKVLLLYGTDKEKWIRAKEVKEFIKEMDNWCEDIGRTTLITAETFMEVLKDKAGDKLQWLK